MGNCLNAASKRSHGGMPPEERESLSEMRRISQLLLLRDHDEEEEQVVQDSAPPPTAAAEGLKVKIVLTRAELEWLMAQLTSGERRLQDVLQHMQAASAAAAHDKAAAWRPRLESISECPETPTTTTTLC